MRFFTFILAIFAVFTLAPHTVYGLDDNDGKYYLPGCYRSEKDANTYTFEFQVKQISKDESKKVFVAQKNVPKNQVSGDKVADQCSKFGAKYLDGTANGKHYNAAQAQESINSVVKNGGWTIVSDDTGSAKPTVKFPQYYMKCSVYGYDGKTYDVWATVSKQTDANTSTTIFNATINDVEGKKPDSNTVCDSRGISTDDNPHTEREATDFINKIKQDGRWTVNQDLTAPGASDPNNYFVSCGYWPKLGGAEVESTHVILYKGNLKTKSYSYIYGNDADPNKAIGKRSCQSWLGVGKTYDDPGASITTMSREEISEEKYNEILTKITDAEKEDEKNQEEYDANKNNSAAQKNCLTEAGALGHILCTTTEGMGSFAESAYENLLEPYLEIDNGLIGNGDQNSTGIGANQGARDAWEVFRNIANAGFIIILIVIIFSQFTGFGIDNYGIKKTLPRFIIAALLVNVSYVLCQAAVDLSNIIGVSVKDLFDTIAGGIGGETDLGTMAGALITSLGIGGAAVGVTIATGGFLALLLPLLLGLLGIVISVLFTFLLLGGRKALVIVLVVLSPLAFLLYALPNTKKVFDKWFKVFKAMLLLYPICGLLMGGGALAASIVNKNIAIAESTSLGNTKDFFTTLAAAAMTTVPVFFVPSLIKGAFAAIGGVGAKLSGLGKSLSGKATSGINRNIRNSDRWKDYQENVGYNRQNRIADRINSSKDAMKGAAKGRFAGARNRIGAARKKFYGTKLGNKITGGGISDTTGLTAAQTKRLARANARITNYQQGLEDSYMSNYKNDYQDEEVWAGESSTTNVEEQFAKMYNDENISEEEMAAFTRYMFSKDGKGATKVLRRVLNKGGGSESERAKNGLRKALMHDNNVYSTLKSRHKGVFDMVQKGKGLLKDHTANALVKMNNDDWAQAGSEMFEDLKEYSSGNSKQKAKAQEIAKKLKESTSPQVRDKVLSDPDKARILNEILKKNTGDTGESAGDSFSDGAGI